MTNSVETSVENSEWNDKQLSFGERIQYLIEKRGISKNWLADQLHISKQALNYLINHSSKPKYIDQLAQILNTRPEWLEKGIGSPFFASIERDFFPVTKIKVYNSDMTLLMLQNEADTEEHEFIDFQCDNASGFIAYRISNDSLFPPFIENTILIFDANKKPSNGDYVLFALEKDKALMVRKYDKDGDDVYYRANNPSYKSLTNVDAVIAGVLIEARYQIRQ